MENTALNAVPTLIWKQLRSGAIDARLPIKGWRKAANCGHLRSNFAMRPVVLACVDPSSLAVRPHSDIISILGAVV